jgi:transcriptional regulator with XRE-family HTH domain
VARESRGELDIIIGAYLRRLREDAGMSGEQVASALNVSQQLISGQENGRKRLSIAQLLKLAALYGRTLAQLVAEMKLDQQRETYFADTEQIIYHAGTVGPSPPKEERERFLIDLNELHDSTERDTVFNLFNRLKQKRRDDHR